MILQYVMKVHRASLVAVLGQTMLQSAAVLLIALRMALLVWTAVIGIKIMTKHAVLAKASYLLLAIQLLSPTDS